MFMFHTAFSLEMIALVAGTFLYVWACRNEGQGAGLAKLIGFIVLVLALIGVICTGVTGWQAYRSGNPMMMGTYCHDMQGSSATNGMMNDTNKMSEKNMGKSSKTTKKT